MCRADRRRRGGPRGRRLHGRRGDGDFHHDDTVFVTHDAERCESRQVFKKVLRNGAKGVFQGKILVKPGAQKTDGYQISQALLLDDEASSSPSRSWRSTPTTCLLARLHHRRDRRGRRLYYLRSRGVPRPRRRPSGAGLPRRGDRRDRGRALRDDIRTRLEQWLERRRG
jgi:Fe-S cluster assembly protein SufD